MKKLQNLELSAATHKKAGRTTIGFRLDEEIYAELSRRAAGLDVSPHELARHYALEVLREPEERTALRKVVNDLGLLLQETRKDIALATEALLISAGTLDEKKAREWTKRNLNSE